MARVHQTHLTVGRNEEDEPEPLLPLHHADVQYENENDNEPLMPIGL